MASLRVFARMEPDDVRGELDADDFLSKLSRLVEKVGDALDD